MEALLQMSLKVYNLWVGIVALLVTLTVFLAVLRSTKKGGSLMHPHISNYALRESSGSLENQSNLRSSPERQTQASPRSDRELEISRTKPRYLQWSVEELESYLDRKAESLSRSEMKELIFHLLPDPIGSEPTFNRLYPGSVSLADQTRLCLKYVDPIDQMALLSAVWSNYRDSSSSAGFLGEVASELDAGKLRRHIINSQVSYYYSNYELFSELLQGGKPIDNIFPNFTAIPGDEETIVSGLRNASIRIMETNKISKNNLIMMISESNLDQFSKSNIINHIDKLHK